jgi:GMP synthase-like glutamine amidotransferase
METLIINNGSKHLADLQKLFIKSNQTINWSEIPLTDITSFDLIILSGSGMIAMESYEKLFKTEVKLILTSNIPIIGICFGCELIAYTFGAKLKRLHNKQKGIAIIRPAGNNDILMWIDCLPFVPTGFLLCYNINNKVE